MSPEGIFIDAHCHLADVRLDLIRDQVLLRARQAGIGLFIQGGVDPEDWERQCQLGSPDWLYAFGLHPWWVARQDKASCLEALERLEAALPRAFALGELGLDFFPRFPEESFELQREMFRLQLEMARKHQKPLVLHLVRCHGEAPGMIRKAGAFKGLVHGFTGSFEVARQYLDLGLLISVGPAVTRPGFKKLKHAVAKIPADRLVIESEAPDGAPAGFPYEMNEPSSIFLIAKAVAELRGVSTAKVMDVSRDNLIDYFGFPDPR